MTINTLDVVIAEKKQYLEDLQNERIERPATKAEYLSLLVKTEQEINDLIAQNNQIIADNVKEQQDAQLALEATPDYKWAQIRARRNQLLSSCDWTQLSDVPLTESEKIAWQAYRQALRDITKQSDPANITWPIAPA